MKKYFSLCLKKMSSPSQKSSNFVHQDLEPVVWRKTVAGVSTEYSQEQRVASNTSKAHKILVSDDPVAPSHVSKEFRTALQQARCAKKLTQKQLAQQCNVTESVIKALELPEALIPSPALLSKINRVLGSSLKKDM